MSVARGWPDPANPGVPPNPRLSGPHLIVDEYGTRRWAWWTPTSDKALGTWKSARTGGRGIDWSYVGPAMAPDGEPVP